MSEEYIKISRQEEYAPIKQKGKRILALDTCISLYESDCEHISNGHDKVRVSSFRRWTVPEENSRGGINAFTIACAPVFKEDESDVEMFEIGMNAIKRSLCNEFNLVALSLRKKLFPEAEEKELIDLELFDNKTRENLNEEDKKREEQHKSEGKSYYNTKY